MNNLVFFLEETSAEEMLKGLLPRLLPEQFHFRCVPFEGKQDMEKQLKGKLRGRRTPNTYFVVLRDKDNGDCRQIKHNLEKICKTANRPDVLIRIACHELESWYLGDLKAVEEGLGIHGLSTKQNQGKFRNPDNLANPAQVFKGLTNNVYQKMSGSRSIGPRLSLENNRSHSFTVFISGIKKLIAEAIKRGPTSP